MAAANEEEKKFIFSARKTSDQIALDYIQRNPLYSGYRVDTPVAEQFSEFLRCGGFREYRYERVDGILLSGLMEWRAEAADEADGLGKLMWDAIRPDNELLKVDFLRNAIFMRCTTVFAALPDVLTCGFLTWLKSTLVDSGLHWQQGNTQMSLRCPAGVLGSMCLRAALSVRESSPALRDELIRLALTSYQYDAGAMELAAQLHNTGKAPLDLTMPTKLSDSQVEAWQLGIVKNAVSEIFRSMFAAPTAAIVT